MGADNRLVLEGLNELREALRDLPDELAAEARAIVQAAGERAAADARAGYQKSRRLGALQDGVFVEPLLLGRFGVGANVVNRNPIAWVFENGSELRHYITKKRGVKKLVGRMPAAHVFIPAMMRARDPMWADLRVLVESKGVTVVDAG